MANEKSEQRMNPEVKAKWVAALRSGEFTQGRGELRTEANAFCCLGVLCELHNREVGGAWARGNSGLSLYMGEFGSLPQPVQQWAGLVDEHNPTVAIDSIRAPLAVHNDGREGNSARTFAELADAIEAQL